MKRVFDVLAALRGKKWAPSTALLAAALVVLSSGAAFAQRLAVSVDAAPLIRGIIVADSERDPEISAFGFAAAVEYLMVPYYSVGARLDFASAKIDSSSSVEIGYVRFALHGRGWPVSRTKMEGIFFDAGFGLANTDYKGDTEVLDYYKEQYGRNIDTFTVTLDIGVGYRFMLGRLFVEPALFYVLEKTPPLNYSPLVVFNDWQPSLSIGTVF